MTDLTKFDKDGNPLNLTPQKTRTPGRYHGKWLQDPDFLEPTAEDLKCELQLQAFSAWEPLKIEIDVNQFNRELVEIEHMWVPYLRREGVMNDRYGMCLMGLPGMTPADGLSMPEAMRQTGNPNLQETDFNHKTEAYHALPSLHPLLDYFQPLGRTMLIRANAGSFFPPHHDSPALVRETFRIVGFPSRNVTASKYEWELDGRIVPIEPGKTYYCDTRKWHRTHSWTDDSVHLILNVPKTWENVLKMMSITEHD